METLMLLDYDISQLEIVKFSNSKARAIARAFKFENLAFSRVGKYRSPPSDTSNIFKMFFFSSLIILLEVGGNSHADI